MSILKKFTTWLNKPKEKKEELSHILGEHTCTWENVGPPGGIKPIQEGIKKGEVEVYMAKEGTGKHLHLAIDEYNGTSELTEEQVEVLNNDNENRQELAKLSAYVKEIKSRVQEPNYLESGKFSPQWKSGWKADEKYYQLPNKKILATLRNGIVVFNKDGITL